MTYDYFIRSWDNDSYRVGHDLVTTPLPQSDKDDIVDTYQPKSFEFGPDQSFWDNWSGPLKNNMLAMNLKRRYEIENSFEYDCVVRIRPDLIFNPAVDFVPKVMVPMAIYCVPSRFTREHFATAIGDLYYYGDSPSMDVLADVYRSYRRDSVTMSAMDNRSFRKFGPNAHLYRHATEMNLLINADFRSGGDTACLLRNSALNAALDPMVDYDEIFLNHRGGAFR